MEKDLYVITIRGYLNDGPNQNKPEGPWSLDFWGTSIELQNEVEKLNNVPGQIVIGWVRKNDTMVTISICPFSDSENEFYILTDHYKKETVRLLASVVVDWIPEGKKVDALRVLSQFKQVRFYVDKDHLKTLVSPTQSLPDPVCKCGATEKEHSGKEGHKFTPSPSEAQGEEWKYENGLLFCRKYSLYIQLNNVGEWLKGYLNDTESESHRLRVENAELRRTVSEAFDAVSEIYATNHFGDRTSDKIESLIGLLQQFRTAKTEKG